MNPPDPARQGAHGPQERHALYEADQSLRNTNAVFNVLDALEPPPGKQRMLRGGLLILAGACLLLALGSLVSRNPEWTRAQPETLSRLLPAENPMDRGRDEAAGAERREGTPGDSGTAADRPALQDSGRTDTARVSGSDEALAAGALQPPVSAVKREAGPGFAGDIGKVRTDALQEGRKHTQQPARQIARKTALHNTKPHAISRARDRNPQAGKPGRPANPIIAKRKAGTADKGRRKDADVDLIAALLLRSRPKPGHADGGDKSLGIRTGAEARRHDVQAGYAAGAQMRDVVIRTQADSTASLLSRCGTLGLIEGHLCRARICDGLWGKDAACPAGNAEKSH